ncbi:OmpA family protein [Pararhodonellum marinum]|uniref:OmpA family protein n=1 Tax=Pararhodonellum marinum TaxID=2755358 RepID=UPI001890ADE9|nr:OmpA family protein [Pararhodonellum marinum]
MTDNLIDLLRTNIDDNVIGKLSGFLGESQAETKKGLFQGAIPAVLGGLISNTNTENDANGLLTMLTTQFSGGAMLDNIGNLFGSAEGTNNMLAKGGDLVSSIMGGKADGVVNSLSTHFGLGPDSINTLMKFAAPMVMSGLAKNVSSKGLGAAGLLGLLNSHKGIVQKLLPGNLGNMFGFSQPEVEPKKNVPEKETVTPPKPAASTNTKNYLPWVLGLVGILLLFLLTRNCNREDDDMMQEDTQSIVSDTTQRVRQNASADMREADASIDRYTVEDWNRLGSLYTFRLPNNTEINAPENGVERRLLDYIASSEDVSNERWFEFDRILFETNNTDLKAESMDQINNISEIMRAYPNVKIKIGGYTDNTGDESANVSLSQARADAVMMELRKKGVGASRISAEGYGSQHPVASNDTDENRQKNRRVAIRVTDK